MRGKAVIFDVIEASANHRERTAYKVYRARLWLSVWAAILAFCSLGACSENYLQRYPTPVINAHEESQVSRADTRPAAARKEAVGKKDATWVSRPEDSSRPSPAGAFPKRAATPGKPLPAPSRAARQHIVRAGDTLFSIAWSNDLDHHALAAHNDISAPFLIRIGQRISLDVPSQLMARLRTKNSRVAKLDSEIWGWPAKGEVVRRFSRAERSPHSGIDIALKRGAPVRAARSGEVVYSGNQVLGRGNMILVSHDFGYLSAYAHNDRNLVAVGDRVKRGQKIALAGDTASKSVHLHFEIRHNGKAINPLPKLTRAGL